MREDFVRHSYVDFEGIQTLKLENPEVAIWVTLSTGPRILGLSAFGSNNLFAVLPDVNDGLPGENRYCLRGGHRLWYAPEHPETTYIPDNEPVEPLVFEDGVELVQSVDRPTMIQKKIRIEVDRLLPKVIVRHTLINTGKKPFELAPWAITQLRPGGLAILPQNTHQDDEHSLQPNRHIVLWPYTRINSPAILWGDEVIFIRASMNEGNLKIGFPNPDGWLAYQIDELLFVKRAEYQPGGEYYDRGASSQTYCDEKCLELETLAPKMNLAPGASAEHVEIWEIYREGNWPGEIRRLYDQKVDEE